MRPFPLVAATLAAVVLPALLATPAQADPYKWCAVYGGGHMGGGGTNCGFITLQQCMATVHGMGGFCEPNQFYDGRPFNGQPSKRTRKRTG